MFSVVITGKVVSDFEFSHETYDEKFYNLKLACKRSSGTDDIVNLLVSDKIVYSDYNLDGMYVGIAGSLRSYNTPNNNVNINVLVETMDLFDEPVQDINNINLDGVICKKTQLRVTDTGRKICSAILAVRRPYGKSDYIPCIFWNRNASCVSKLDVGSKLHIEGRLQSRNYEKNNDVQTTYEVSVQSLEIL